MIRLPLIVSILALVVAVVAAGATFRGEDTAKDMGLDRAAVETMIDTRIAAAGEAAPNADTGLDRAAVEAMIDTRVAAANGAGADIDPDTIGPIVRDYMVAHPEILEDVLAALEVKRENDKVFAQTEALDQYSEKIFRSPFSPVGGNPAGDVTLVEFFDYNCGYCKRMLPSLVDLLKTDPKLRVVFKEWPVLSEGSVEAARIASAVSTVAPDKYVDFHVNLMSQPGGGEGINKERALQVVDELGIDRDAVIEASKSPDVDEAIDENFQVAEALGLRGTPSYVIGQTVIPGAVSFEELQRTIAEAREADCETC